MTSRNLNSIPLDVLSLGVQCRWLAAFHFIGFLDGDLYYVDAVSSDDAVQPTTGGKKAKKKKKPKQKKPPLD